MGSILTYVGYSLNDTPRIETSERPLLTLGKSGTIEFNTSQRYCTGWHDLATGDSHQCPEQAVVEPKYHECQGCQRRTGFNPAFYHASSVSKQQEERNAKPHILYLALFGTDTLKVGISYEGRGLSRLREQGAWSALILDTFPNADIARQYEAKIATLGYVHEHLQSKKKFALFKEPYEPAVARRTLNDALARIQRDTGVSFEKATYYDFFEQYFISEQGSISDIIDISDKKMISGDFVGLFGPYIVARYEDQLVACNLKSFIGYRSTFIPIIEELELPDQQMSLF